MLGKFGSVYGSGRHRWLRRVSVILVAMLVASVMVASPASAALTNPDDFGPQASGGEATSLRSTGTSPEVERQAQWSAQSSTLEGDEPVSVAVSGEEGTITFRTLREVRDSSLPELIKEDFLDETDFSGLTEAELDAEFDEDVVVDVAEAEVIAQRAAELLADPYRRTTRGFCSKWKSYNQEFDIDLDPSELTTGFSEPQSVNLANGLNFQAEAAGEFGGEVKVTVDFHYEVKRNKYICIPYGGRFKHADIVIDASVNGDIGAAASLNLADSRRLWEKTLHLWEGDVVDINVEYLRFKIVADVDVLLAVDLEMQARLAASINEGFELDAAIRTEIYCWQGGCEQRAGTHSHLNMSHKSNTGTQATLDMKLIPSAELKFGLKVYVGDPFWIFPTRLVSGTVGLVAALPMRLFVTRGNLCSDADGDGSNEDVSLTLVDISAQLSAYWSLEYLGRKSLNWFADIGGLDTWDRRTRFIRWDPGTSADHQTIYEKNLYLKVLQQGRNSPLQPVISHAGVFDRGEEVGQEEGIVISGPRSCFPFESEPKYEIDWSRSTAERQTFEGNGFVAHDWEDDGSGDAVAVRMVGDDSGRTFVGPWVLVELADLYAPSGHPYCVDSRDPDGDGWGWENQRSCVMSPSDVPEPDGGDPEPSTSASTCASSDSDPDGDGWGWENGESCQVSQEALGTPICRSATSDPDGDGWGWENNESCVVL